MGRVWGGGGWPGMREWWLGLTDGNDGTGDDGLMVLVVSGGSKPLGRGWRRSPPPTPPHPTLPHVRQGEVVRGVCG